MTLGNIWVDIVWLIMVIIFDAIILFHARKNLKKISRTTFINDIKNNLKIPRFLISISYVLILFPTFAALFSPQPKLYFLAFAAFYRKNIYYVSQEAISWHSDVMGVALDLAFIGLLVLWISSQHKKTPFRFVLCTIAFEILWFSNKRTFGMLIIILLLIIDILYSKRFPIFKTLAVLLGCIAYFAVYQVLAKNANLAIDMTFTATYHLYFSRVMDMKLVIYSLLYPERLQILEYWGQSALYDILFFVPRAIWENKPYPFAMYYSAAIKLGSIEQVNGRFLTSFFAEMIANFSWFGVPIGLFLYYKIVRFVEKIKNPIVYLFGVYTVIYLMITQFGSNLTHLCLLFLLYVLIEKKIFKRIKLNRGFYEKQNKF